MFSKYLNIELYKKFCIKLLEKHPFGYLIGTLFVKFDIFLPHEDDYYGFKVLQQRGLPGKKVILDIGGNQGHSSRGFFKILDEYEVVCFEALDLHKESLNKIKLKYKNKFNYYIKSVGNESQIIKEIFMPFYHGLALHSAAALDLKSVYSIIYGMWPKLKFENSIVIKKLISEMIRIDELNLEFNMMKIDIQGAEYQALIGMENSIILNKPVILIETQIGSENLDQLLKRLGYSPYIYNATTKEFTCGTSLNGRNTFYIPLCYNFLINYK